MQLKYIKSLSTFSSLKKVWTTIIISLDVSSVKDENQFSSCSSLTIIAMYLAARAKRNSTLKWLISHGTLDYLIVGECCYQCPFFLSSSSSSSEGMIFQLLWYLISFYLFCHKMWSKMITICLILEKKFNYLWLNHCTLKIISSFTFLIQLNTSIYFPIEIYKKLNWLHEIYIYQSRGGESLKILFDKKKSRIQ